MQRSRSLIIGGIVSAIGLIALLLILRARGPAHPPGRLGPPSGGCPGRTDERAEKTTMTDTFMPGLLEAGQEMQVTWNWYACHAPEKGEIALLRLSRALPPQARVIRAVPGDVLALKRNATGPGWNLLVDDRPVEDFQGRAYFFGGDAVPPIGRYLEMRGKVLGPGSVVLLSTRSPGGADSGQFGVSSVEDLVAKVEPIR